MQSAEVRIPGHRPGEESTEREATDLKDTHSYPSLLSPEDAPTLFLNLCVLGVNIPEKSSPLCLEKAHDFELVRQTQRCSKGDFLGKATASALGAP